jgi:hypothetical protein
VIASYDFRVIATVAVLFLVVVVLGYRLLNRDPNIQRTRFGFFVERDRHVDEDVGGSPWPRSLPSTLDDTQEIPPKEET